MQGKNSTSEPMRDAVQFLADSECTRLSANGVPWRVSGIEETPNPNNVLPDSLYKWKYTLTNDARKAYGVLVFDSQHHFNVGTIES